MMIQEINRKNYQRLIKIKTTDQKEEVWQQQKRGENDKIGS